MTPMARPWVQRVVTLLVAVVGLGIALAINLPLAFLFGPMLACLAAALVGVPLRGFGQVSTAARTILGVAVGASVTPALLAQLPSMAVSLALVPIYVAVIGLVGVPYFRRVCGLDPVTAFYAAMPGGAQDMVLFGQEAGGDARALSLVHATRVAVIVAVAPILLTGVYGLPLDRPVGAAAADVPLREMALMVVAAIVGWKGGERLGLFGAAILGPLIVTMALSLSGFIHVRPPREAILAAQFLIGISIGAFYAGVTWRELTRTVASGAAFVLILAVLALIFAEAVVWVGLAPPVEAFLAFAPGGQAEMTVLAIVSGADLGFVVIHHLARLMIVILGAPIVARLVTRR